MVTQKNRRLYLVVSQTGTILSRIVKYVTRDKYNHVSISLRDNLDDLYSFGRKNPYNPFKGGLVKESPTTGTFKRFHKTKAVVLEVPVTEEVYSLIDKELSDMYEHKEEYHYNYIGLFIAYFGKTRSKKNTYYCSEFVQALLSKYGLGLKKGAKELVCPNDFVNVPDGRILYTGRLRDYSFEDVKAASEQGNMVCATV